MSELMALDVAILPPPAIVERAMALSATLPAGESKGLRLGEHALPHVTLTQQFVRVGELDVALERIDEVLRDQRPLALRVTGGATGGSSSVWMGLELTPALADLHERLMEALRGVERAEGTPAAFLGGDARLSDVLWVATFRVKSALAAYTPHITLGHASEPPPVEPMTFEGRTVAACHLGRFCTCRQVLRSWILRE